MAAGTWKVYAKAKKYIGNGTITLGAGVFKLCLHKTSASAKVKLVSTIDTWASIASEIAQTGGYTTGGENLAPATAQWTVGASAKQYKFTYSTGWKVTGSIASVKYAVIRNSTGAGAGKALCYCTLSTAAFAVTGTNTLTITPNASGVFTLA